MIRVGVGILISVLYLLVLILVEETYGINIPGIVYLIQFIQGLGLTGLWHVGATSNWEAGYKFAKEVKDE